jgi:hypothetical protein
LVGFMSQSSKTFTGSIVSLTDSYQWNIHAPIKTWLEANKADIPFESSEAKAYFCTRVEEALECSRSITKTIVCVDREPTKEEIEHCEEVQIQGAKRRRVEGPTKFVPEMTFFIGMDSNASDVLWVKTNSIYVLYHHYTVKARETSYRHKASYYATMSKFLEGHIHNLLDFPFLCIKTL